MSVVKNAGRALMMSAILSAPAFAQVPRVPEVPMVPMVPMVMPAIPAMPLMPVIPPMPMIPDFEMPDLSALAPMLADLESALASIGPIGPGPMSLGPIGFGPGGFGPKIAMSFDRQRSREDEARQREDESRQRAEEEKQRESERRQRIDENYQRGQESLERRAWARAADSFTRVIDAQNSTRVDAALYWKAYSLDKLNQQADALTAVQDLIKRFPQRDRKSVV